MKHFIYRKKDLGIFLLVKMSETCNLWMLGRAVCTQSYNTFDLGHERKPFKNPLKKHLQNGFAEWKEKNFFQYFENKINDDIMRQISSV